MIHLSTVTGPILIWPAAYIALLIVGDVWCLLVAMETSVVSTATSWFVLKNRISAGTCFFYLFKLQMLFSRWQ
jgi:hypothetical protein